MTQHDDLVYLGHMLDIANEAVSISEGKTFADFEQEKVLQYALVHALQIIEEVARSVSLSRRDTLSEIPWNQIVGMRHRIVNDYFEINLERVWDTLVIDLPVLIKGLEKVVPAEPPE